LRDRLVAGDIERYRPDLGGTDPGTAPCPDNLGAGLDEAVD
jgi:hypothetical protein